MIDLIIKPTQACNFKCTFCSSNKIADSAHSILDLNVLFNFMENNEVKELIINGGDPLMMPPKYYYDILNFIDKKSMNTHLSFTTNLWDFYKHPSKWEDLFKKSNVGVCTSFQYGNERRIANGEVFTESMFIDIFNMFKEKIGYKLNFISVITEENEGMVLDTVKLAQKLGTECKINPAVMSGRSLSFYPLYKAYEKYLDITENGLGSYEKNCIEIKKMLKEESTICPLTRNCYENIRCLNPDNVMHSCGCFNDDHLILKESGKKTYCLSGDDTIYKKEELKNDFKFLKSECLCCNMFKLCNSCYKRISDIKTSGTTDIHCKNMKALEDRIKKIL